ncbi:MAG: 3,4-dihydroxy-2-butanone-4-phosphate synthase [Verrucomicrobiota bacterium]
MSSSKQRRSQTTSGFDTIQEVIAEIRCGRLVIITDDASRENEGDLVCAAAKITPAKINFMAKHARGLICAPITQSRASQLGLQRMVVENRESFQTDFTISVDGAGKHGVSTGISAHDRSKTIKLLSSQKTTARDLVQPGHVFPLQAKEGGVLQRAGHTEAAVDLARLAGLDESAVICEILKENGRLARLPDLKKFAKTHTLKMACIQDLIEYRRTQKRLVIMEESTPIQTDYGTFQLYLYRSTLDRNHHLALVKGEINESEPALVRVHSESLLNDAFGSRRDTGSNPLHDALKMIGSEPNGVLIYMRTDDHGNELARRVASLKQKSSPNSSASPPPAPSTRLREYGLGAQILYDLGVRKMKLLTNHPKNVVGLSGYGIELVEQIPIRNKKQKIRR